MSIRARSADEIAAAPGLPALKSAVLPASQSPGIRQSNGGGEKRGQTVAKRLAKMRHIALLLRSSFSGSFRCGSPYSPLVSF